MRTILQQEREDGERREEQRSARNSSLRNITVTQVR